MSRSKYEISDSVYVTFLIEILSDLMVKAILPQNKKLFKKGIFLFLYILYRVGVYIFLFQISDVRNDIYRFFVKNINIMFN